MDFFKSCPHCGNQIHVVVNSIYADFKAEKEDAAPDQDASYRERLTDAEQRFVSQLQETGIAQAILNAYGKQTGHENVRNKTRFLLSYFRDVRPIPVPAESLEALISTYGGSITVLAHIRVCLVLSSGRPVLAIPQDFLSGARLKIGGALGSMARSNPSQAGISEWIRSRNGYIPEGAAIFREALAEKYKGSFELTDTVRRRRHNV